MSLDRPQQPMVRFPFPTAPIAILVGAGALTYVAAIMWSGSAATLEAITRVGLLTMVVGTIIASSAYLVRFARWHALLKWLGHRLPLGFNLRVYLAGLALTASPGKLGETIRSALLLPRGVSLPRSLAAFFADRLSDVIGVALLGSVAGFVVGRRLGLLEAIVLFTLGTSFVARAVIGSRTWQASMAGTDKRSRVRRALTALSLPALAWASVWTMPRALLCTAYACLAYGVQALVFAAYVAAAGQPLPTAQCVAIFASATLIGAASMIPSGLGAMEASLVYQLVDAGVPRASAVATVIGTRASTLWFGLLLGSLMLLILSQDSFSKLRSAPSGPSDPQ
jgi:uncharacterized membrane protein YbhN (UPF0104 family)